MQRKQQPSRPSSPADAFPDKQFGLWRDFVLERDNDVILAAAIAEKLNGVLDARRAVTGETMRGLAAAIGVPRGVLMTTARCLSYPQASTIARLQQALSASLDPTVDILLVTLAAHRTRATAASAEIRRLTGDLDRVKRDLTASAHEIALLRTQLAARTSRIRTLEKKLTGQP